MKLQLLTRFRWYFGDRKGPKPALFYPTDGWTTDPDEIIRAIRQDDAFIVKKRK